MSEKKLGTFKIGDTQRPGIGAPRAGVPAPQEPSGESLGFDRIEAVLDNESPAQVSADLDKIHQALEDLQTKASTHKDRASAKKAMAAVELTADLLDYLYQTKATLEAKMTTK